MSTDKLAETSQPIHELLARRWSPRAFDPAKAVTRAQLISILEAARWAPSCSAAEPWRFIVWDRMRNERDWQRAFDCLDPGNQEWVVNAPVLIASFADSRFRSGKPNRWGQHDTGAANENLYLQATALGLQAHPMAGYDRERLVATFAIPPEFTPMAMIALGHPGNPDTLSEKNRARELAKRVRRPLRENFFENTWENPVALE